MEHLGIADLNLQMLPGAYKESCEGGKHERAGMEGGLGVEFGKKILFFVKFLTKTIPWGS